MFKRLLKLFPDKNYIKSNSIESILIGKENFYNLYEELEAAFTLASLEKIEEVSIKIINTLKKETKIKPDIFLTVGESSKSAMGYVIIHKGKKHRIRLYSKTPKRKALRKPKVFLNTILHEFSHIYDIEKIRLKKTIHCKGFYSRIASLQNLFIPTEEK